MPYKAATAIVFVTLTLTACTTIRETQPTQTAREQLLLSTAADLASAKIEPNLPKGNAIYVDSSYFRDPDTDSSEYRESYAIARIRAQLLSDGYRLVESADQADTIAEISTGALSIDQSDHLLGIPSAPIPIPLAGTLKTPELALYKKAVRTGVAKFDVAFYDARTGARQDIVGPVYGFSHVDRSSILGIGWKNSNILPPEARAEMKGKSPSSENN